MQNLNSGHKHRYNKNALIRRPSDKIPNKINFEALISDTKVKNRETITIDTIRIVTGDDDPDSAVLSLKEVVSVFLESVIVFNFGTVDVYLNPRTDLLHEVENTGHDEQKDISQLHDVYSRYKTFLLYRNKNGRVLILPKTQRFHTVFKRLYHGLQNNETLAPKMVVLLKDINKPKYGGETLEEYGHRSNGSEYYHVNYVFAPKSETMFKESKTSEKWEQVVQTDLRLEKTKSLMMSKKKLKAISPSLRSIPSLPSIPPPFPRSRIYCQFPYKEQLKFPELVSDDDQLHSEQVVSNYSSTVHRDYAISSPSSVTNGAYSHATSNLQPSIQEPGRLEQHRPRVPPRHPDYYDYTNRLMSYTNWMHRAPDPARLSQAGFFFTNQGDLVRCFQCGIGLKDFSPDDDPLLEHVRHSRQCPFLPEFLGVDGMARYQTRLQAVDPEFNRQQQWAERQNGSVPRSNYRHPEYQAIDARLSSFTTWPLHMSQTPQQLAQAGLYYTGFEDQVRCFACDGGLRRWDPEDDPWTEHCRWFPACPYALEQKGEQFIAFVQASVENERYGASGGGVQDLTSTMEQLKLRESTIEAVMTLYRAVCLDMGYKEGDVKEAVQEFLERGNENPSLEDIIVLIDVIRDRKLENRHSSANESPLDENKRLKRIVFCMNCGKNNVNALFLPCTHHELCMTCAGPLNECPVCRRGIREKIRTYMV